MTMVQRSLFDGSQDFEPCDPTVPIEERPRLARQCREILARLRSGPVTTAELAAIALKYTGRLSDLRKAGIDVRLWRRDSGGNNVYGLGPRPEGN